MTTAPGRVLYFNWDLKNATREPRMRAKELGHPLPSEPKLPRFQKDKTPIFDLMTRAVLECEDGKWDTVISDHIVEHNRRLLEEQTGRSRRPALEARGNAWSDIERWCRALCEAPVNFILVAHEMTQERGEGLESIPFVGTKGASTGGIGTKLKGMVDFIGYTGVVEIEGESQPQYMAQLRPGKGSDGAQRDAGSRFGTLMDESYRVVDLEAWFRAAGVHVGKGNPQTRKQEAANE